MASATDVGKALGGFLDDNLGTIAGIGGAWAIGDQMRSTGDSANTQMTNLATQLATDSAFKGYGVTSGLGTSTVDPQGNLNLGVGRNSFYTNQARDRFTQAGQSLNNSGNLYRQGATNALSGQAQSMLGSAGQMGAYNKIGRAHV